LLAVLTACSSGPVEINTFCQRDAVGNYLVKWETRPEIKGQVQFFVSDFPDMRREVPAGHSDIQNGVFTYITSDNISRKYFRLVFNGLYSRMVAARSVQMDSIPNFRDLGGYLTTDGESTCWGKIFRSGDISNMGDIDLQRLSKLGIRTIIDLRSVAEADSLPITYPLANIVHIPVDEGMEDLIGQIEAGQMFKGDVSVFMQDAYLRFTGDTLAWAKVLHILTKADSYPVLLTDVEGKDCVGFLSALLLLACRVPEAKVLRDYMDTNNHINIARYRPMAETLDSNAQEALTSAISVNELFLSQAISKIMKDYGGINAYLQKEGKLSGKQERKLRRLLLTPLDNK
jgi:protein-tyrosine phosphatase